MTWIWSCREGSVDCLSQTYTREVGANFKYRKQTRELDAEILAVLSKQAHKAWDRTEETCS